MMRGKSLRTNASGIISWFFVVGALWLLRALRMRMTGPRCVWVRNGGLMMRGRRKERRCTQDSSCATTTRVSGEEEDSFNSNQRQLPHGMPVCEVWAIHCLLRLPPPPFARAVRGRDGFTGRHA